MSLFYPGFQLKLSKINISKHVSPFMYYPSYKSLNTTRREEIHEFKYRIHSLIGLLKSLETNLNNAMSQQEPWTPDTLDVAYNSKCILECTLNILEQYCWLWSQLPEETLRNLDVDAFFKLKDKSKDIQDKNMQVTMYLNTMPQIVERLEENFYKIFDELKKRYTNATKEEFKNRLSQKHAEKRQENPEKRLDW